MQNTMYMYVAVNSYTTHENLLFQLLIPIVDRTTTASRISIASAPPTPPPMAPAPVHTYEYKCITERTHEHVKSHNK